MKFGARTSALAAVMATALAGQAFAGVALDAATQKRLGVATAPLAAARYAGTINGFARVLDPVPLATLDSDLLAAQAAARASAAEAARTKTLAAADATISLKIAQAAQAQAGADAAKLALLRRRVGMEWGVTFMADDFRARLLAELVAGRAALVRIDAPSGAANARSVQLDLGQGDRPAVAILGAARTADTRLQSGGLIGVVRGPAATRLAAGLTAPAVLSGAASTSGVLAPRSAVMRAQGKTFVYVRQDPTHFERRVLTGVVPQTDGLFAADGARPGESVVVSGAAAIFAAENAPKAED
jgi:hypothetical protein